MVWWKRTAKEGSGSAFFRGALPPRAESYEGLARAGIEVARAPDASDTHWTLDLRHPDWGNAKLVCLRAAPMPPQVLIDYDPRLTSQQRADAKAAGCLVSVRRPMQSDNVLRERKHFLHFLRAAMGEHGLVGIDHLSQAFWSREALDDELAHDADVDIQALFTVHAVLPEGGREPYWLHSHGLSDLGFVDFDVHAPDPDLTRHQWDLLRALAFAIAEGRAEADGGALDLAQPDGVVRLVSVDRFLALKSASPEWRADLEDGHRRGHVVVCDPTRPRWLGLFEAAPRPSRFFTGPIPEEILVSFSRSATDLMATRARATYSVLRGLVAELEGLPLRASVKSGYVVDGGRPDECEHLWFEVHECHDHAIDATLLNEPFGIARMRAGQRATLDPGLITDWLILTPFGQVTPRSMTPMRELRTHRGELERAFQQDR